MKTKKAILKRFKITGRGKILHRPVSQDHFNAKDRSAKTRKKRKLKPYILRNKKLKKIL